MTTGKNIALTMWTFLDKVMSLLLIADREDWSAAVCKELDTTELLNWTELGFHSLSKSTLVLLSK